MTYKCKNFKIHELVGHSTYQNTPEWKLWLSFDERLLRIIDILREEIGVPITINDWKWGGNFSESGLRVPGMEYYSPWSQHSFGRAFDLKFKGLPAYKAREKIKKLMEEGKFKGITNTITCEETKTYRDNKQRPLTWCHIDLRNNKPGYNEFYI